MPHFRELNCKNRLRARLKDGKWQLDSIHFAIILQIFGKRGHAFGHVVLSDDSQHQSGPDVKVHFVDVALFGSPFNCVRVAIVDFLNAGHGELRIQLTQIERVIEIRVALRLR
jgi:hypothetical protein